MKKRNLLLKLIETPSHKQYAAVTIFLTIITIVCGSFAIQLQQDNSILKDANLICYNDINTLQIDNKKYQTQIQELSQIINSYNTSIYTPQNTIIGQSYQTTCTGDTENCIGMSISSITN